jgi:hypothetical protein
LIIALNKISGKGDDKNQSKMEEEEDATREAQTGEET